MLTSPIFYTKAAELVAAGKVFDRVAMKDIPYCDLPLCAIGDAGAARCRMHLVREEQKSRLYPFLKMPLEELEAIKTSLDDAMFADIMALRRAKVVRPSWHDLTDAQKLYFKLRCLRNHWDGPRARLRDALTIMANISKETKGADLRFHPIQQGIIRLMADDEKGVLDGQNLRETLKGYRELLATMLTPEQKAVCESAELSDYNCTNDCFRPTE